MPDLPLLLQTAGALLGVAGAFLVTSTDRARRRTAFGLWIGSNAALIGWHLGTGAWPALAMQCVYLGTAAAGWWTHRKETP